MKSWWIQAKKAGAEVAALKENAGFWQDKAENSDVKWWKFNFSMAETRAGIAKCLHLLHVEKVKMREDLATKQKDYAMGWQLRSKRWSGIAKKAKHSSDYAMRSLKHIKRIPYGRIKLKGATERHQDSKNWLSVRRSLSEEGAFEWATRRAGKIVTFDDNTQT